MKPMNTGLDWTDSVMEVELSVVLVGKAYPSSPDSLRY